MGLLDIALAPLRSLLGAAEQEAEHVFPVRDLEDVEQRVLETAQAVRRATESIEAHVAVVETLATSLPPLTEAVTQLTVQLGEILKLTAPLAALEHDVGAAERRISRVEHLFGRGRHDEPPAPPPPSAS
jgi:hypothetical protein